MADSGDSIPHDHLVYLAGDEKETTRRALKKSLFILLILVAGLFVPYLSASANFYENFDTYQAGTLTTPGPLNPGMWLFKQNSTTCYPIAPGGAVPSQVYNEGNPASPPNDYLIDTQANVGADCAATHEYGVLQQWFNASNPSIAVTAYVRNAIFASTPAAGNFNFIINQTSYKGASTVYATTLTNVTDAHTIGASYKKFISVVPAVPGSNVSIQIGFQTQGTGSFPLANPTGWEIDNLSIIGGNGIIKNYNFEMVNASNQQWFSIASFNTNQPSRVLVNYTGGTANDSAQWAPAGVQLPDIKYAGLGTSKLITVYIGNFYSRSLIPSPNGVVTKLYLDNPISVVAYTVNVLGPPNVYGANSKFYVQQGGKNITSGYLSSDAQFAASLIPGSFVVIVISQDGTVTQSQTMNFPATASILNYNAYANVVVKNPAGIVSSIEWQAGWNATATGIVVNYLDNLSSTCGANNLGIAINRVNGSGSFVVFSAFYTVSGCHVPPAQAFSVTIPAATNQLNKTLSAQLFVYLNATNFLGTHFNLGSQGLACFGCLLSGPLFGNGAPNLPLDTLGLPLLPGISWLTLIAYAIVVLTSAAFGIFWSRFGFLVAAFETAFFVFAGWLPIAPTIQVAETIVMVFMVLAFIGLMIFHERT